MSRCFTDQSFVVIEVSAETRPVRIPMFDQSTTVIFLIVYLAPMIFMIWATLAAVGALNGYEPEQDAIFTSKSIWSLSKFLFTMEKATCKTSALVFDK